MRDPIASCGSVFHSMRSICSYHSGAFGGIGRVGGDLCARSLDLDLRDDVDHASNDIRQDDAVPIPDHLRVKREPKRGVYDRDAIETILDEALFCHLGFAVDGQPYVIPTLHARAGDRLFVHGSAASRMLRTAAGGVRVCVTVTLLDGLVLAKSVFNHSINYRSAVVLGTATLVGDDEKVAVLRAFTEHVAPGRWDEARQPSAKELKATWILSLPLDESSAKVRTGGPDDEPEDEELDVWAGVVPIHLAAGPSEYAWRRVRDGRLGSGR